jgi:flavin reductase (DIM6/NTAB) family NADH-FMN oxidoreductase RutF
VTARDGSDAGVETGSGDTGSGDTGEAEGVPRVVDDRLRRRVLWAMPSGLYVVGSAAGGRANLMTANLAIQVSVEPKLVGIVIDTTSVTHGLISAGGGFSLSLLGREDRVVVRRFVKPVPHDEVVTEGSVVVSMAGEPVSVHVTGSPVLARAVAWLDCALRHRLALGSHEMFVGEVVAVGGPEGDVPPVLRMEDTRMNYGG